MRVWSCLLPALLSALLAPAGLCADTATNALPYTFAGHEIFPIDEGISLLHAADLNGDGLNDLVVADNLRSKIVLLYNQTGRTNPPPANPAPLDINQLPPGSRFRLDSIPTDERLASLAVADLNGDGRPDLVFYGDGRDLEVLYNQGTNGSSSPANGIVTWSEPNHWHIEDGHMDANALAVGDLNGDGRPDIVLLGDNGALYFLPQRADHTFGEPEKIPYSGNPKAVQLCDINGDGRKDLLLVDWDSPTPFRFRLQTAAGQLGPEMYFKTQPIRSYCADNLEGGSKNFIVTIAQTSGRAEVWQFLQQPAEKLSGAFRRGQFQILPLRRTDAARRGELWADVNGDGRPDLLVAEPDSGQLAVYLQQPDGSLAAPKVFPTLAGVSQLAVADWNGDGQPEIFLLSPSEHAVGMTSFDRSGRLPFPNLVPFDGKPLVMAVGPLRPGAPPTLCVIAEDQNGRRSLITRTADGKMKMQRLSESFKSNPVSMGMVDVNQDGLVDLVVLIPYEKIKVLLQKSDGSFDETDVDPPGGTMDQPWLATADVDGDGKPELLLPQKNFIRAVVLEKELRLDNGTNQPAWVFHVRDQINGAASDSRITGATAVMDGTNRFPALFLLDAAHRQLTLCQRDTNGVWRVTRNVDLPVADFTGLQTVALGGTNLTSVTFLGLNAVAWLPLGGEVWDFTALDGYDTPIKDGYLNDVVAGDLTGDGRKDLVFLETAKNYLDIVRFNPEHKLVPSLRWQVFEQHTFRGVSSTLPEPREAVVADVTGNGKNDLVVIVHNNILLYPQQ
jgi:hypothetical protein